MVQFIKDLFIEIDLKWLDRRAAKLIRLDLERFKLRRRCNDAQSKLSRYEQYNPTVSDRLSLKQNFLGKIYRLFPVIVVLLDAVVAYTVLDHSTEHITWLPKMIRVFIWTTVLVALEWFMALFKIYSDEDQLMKDHGTWNWSGAQLRYILLNLACFIFIFCLPYLTIGEANNEIAALLEYAAVVDYDPAVLQADITSLRIRFWVLAIFSGITHLFVIFNAEKILSGFIRKKFSKMYNGVEDSLESIKDAIEDNIGRTSNSAFKYGSHLRRHIHRFGKHPAIPNHQFANETQQLLNRMGF